jgi:hypothetical protein
MKIEYKPTKDADARTIEVNFAKTDFTDQEVWEHAEANMVVKIQGRMRAHCAKVEAGKDDDSFPSNDAEWIEFLKPRARLTPVDKAKKVLEGLTDEQKAEILAMLKKAK